MLTSTYWLGGNQFIACRARSRFALIIYIKSLLCRMPDSVTHPERVVIAQAEASSMDAESLLVVP
jgi:hypothetical protein